jgi:hypothetical protein
MAIIDRREIEFDREAVRLVLESSPKACQSFGPPSRLPDRVRCRPTEGLVEVSYGKLTETRVFMLRAEALGAILISYCNRTGMPMPRAADKAVRIEREHVVMVLTLRMHHAPKPDAPEGRINRLPDAVRAFAWVEGSC